MFTLLSTHLPYSAVLKAFRLLFPHYYINKFSVLLPDVMIACLKIITVRNQLGFKIRKPF